MAFPKTLKAANATSFAVVAEGDTVNDGGFLVSEDQVNAIESSLADSETQIANLTTARDNATAAVATANTATEAANTRLANANTRISNLEAEVARLKAGPAGGFTATTATEDPVIAGKADGKNKYRTTFDEEAEQYSRKRK